MATPWPLGTPISVGNHFGATEKSNELFSLFRWSNAGGLNWEERHRMDWSARIMLREKQKSNRQNPPLATSGRFVCLTVGRRWTEEGDGGPAWIIHEALTGSWIGSLFGPTTGQWVNLLFKSTNEPFPRVRSLERTLLAAKQPVGSEFFFCISIAGPHLLASHWSSFSVLGFAGNRVLPDFFTGRCWTWLVGSCLVLLFVSQCSFLFTDSLQVRGLGFPFRRSRSEAVHDYAATYLMDEISLMALDIFFFFVTLASRQSASFARALLDLIVVDGKANRWISIISSTRFLFTELFFDLFLFCVCVCRSLA